MDDLILFAAGAAIMALMVYAVSRYRKYCDEQEVARIAEERKQIEETRKWREHMHEKMKKESPSTVPPRGKEMTKTYVTTYSSSPTQSVQASRSDDGIDMITNMMVMNAIMQHHQPSASTSNEIVSTSSSYDSGPSYRDDSPSSSWSSSSSDSSSSWSSSSDSGPSSDW